MESKGVIRGIVAEGKTLLVCFPQHDGYFRVDDPALKKRVRQAQRDAEEIRFRFDRELRILEISGG